MNAFDAPARLFKVLGNPARLAILDVLRDGEQCVCHIEAMLGYRQAYISQHLMLLREAGLVADRRDGLNIFYRVADPGLLRLIDGALPGARRKSTGRAGVNRPACDCPKCQPAVIASSSLDASDGRRRGPG